MNRVRTGVQGLDELIQGGIPEGSTVLISGGAGTCKTILGMTYIYEGAKQYKEPGLYVTLEENKRNIMWNMQSFSWDIKPFEEKNLIKIYKLNLNPKDSVEVQVEAELKEISKIVKEIGAKRLVVDSTTAFGVWIKDQGAMRSLLYRFTDGLKDIGTTTLLIAETSGEKGVFSAFGVEEFVADGVIALYFSPPNRSIFVRKMRGTNHSKSAHPFQITDNGITISPKDTIMWESIK